MPDLLALSARYIDEGIYEGPGSINRPTSQLSELGTGVSIVEAFSHVVAFETGDGLVLFDTSLEQFGPMVVRSLREWSKSPVNTIAYTHGHVDHIGGAQTFVEEASSAGRPEPRVVAHEAVPARFDRYRMTNGYNAVINARQFGNLLGDRGMHNEGQSFGPATWVEPNQTFREQLSLTVGEVDFELHHGRGETDDHLWAWVPQHRAVCVGDFVIWAFPNAGNPQKVQRYPLEWARTLRAMAAKEPELLLPAHGLPVGGKARVRGFLEDIATALETIVEQVLERMNDGATLDDIVHSVKAPPELLDKPFLRPTYDEPEFVVRNCWRLYGGWHDGNPARLKPAKDAALAAEIAALAGGADRLAARGRELAEAGDWRLACHLVELAVQAEPDSRGAHEARAAVYRGRRSQELSLMSKGIYRAAAEQSESFLKGSS